MTSKFSIPPVKFSYSSRRASEPVKLLSPVQSEDEKCSTRIRASSTSVRKVNPQKKKTKTIKRKKSKAASTGEVTISKVAAECFELPSERAPVEVIQGLRFIPVKRCKVVHQISLSSPSTTSSLSTHS